MKETFAVLEQQFKENKAEMEKNWQTKIELLKEEFKTLSSEILKEKSGHLADVNQNQLSALLKPLQEKLGDFKTAVDQAKEKGISLNSELKEQIAHLLSATKQIGDNANNLASALKGNSKTQGNWGEMILEEILVNSGLKKGIHYECQETLRDEDGNPVQNDNNRLMRPDVIVHYPDGKDVIIDSKVSLSAYTDYMNAESDEDRKNALARHNRSVRSHVDELVRKNYSSYLRRQQHEAVDFVIMFIPTEPAFLAAVQYDNGLWDEAYRKKVIISSPTNLFGMLKIVDDLWKRDDLGRNANRIAREGAMMYDKFVGFVTTLETIGKNIDTMQGNYDKAMKQLRTGTGNLVSRAQRLSALNIKVSKSLPQSMLEESDDLPVEE